jgi:hypothetical protein
MLPRNDEPPGLIRQANERISGITQPDRAMSERQFAISGNWALGADRLQWILYRRNKGSKTVPWVGTSFVSSTRAILERCMREKGVPEDDRAVLLAGLPPTFDQWLKTHQSGHHHHSERQAEEITPRK